MSAAMSHVGLARYSSSRTTSASTAFLRTLSMPFRQLAFFL